MVKKYTCIPPVSDNHCANASMSAYIYIYFFRQFNQAWLECVYSIFVGTGVYVCVLLHEYTVFMAIMHVRRMPDTVYETLLHYSSMRSRMIALCSIQYSTTKVKRCCGK